LNRILIKYFAVFILLIIGQIQLSHADPTASSWKLVSPRPDKVIKSGALFINIKLLDSVQIITGSLQLLIDDNLITNFVKFSPDAISILYTQPLPEGKHKIELTVKSQKLGYMTPIKSFFYVNKFSGSNKDSVIVKKADFFELSGTLIASDKELSYSGPGAASAELPPNVPYVRDIDADIVARIGKVSFPVKYFRTSDQDLYPSGIQSRNYFQYGVRYAGAELLFGDQTPAFDRLVLSGIRVKGWMFSYTSSRFKIQVVNGVSQLAQEGQLLRYHPSDSMIPPPNLRADSNYIVPGIYQRELTAARISFGNPIEGSVIGINILRSRDDTNSIRYGGNAMDNLVIGADENFLTNGSKMKINAGFAISALTNNTRGGPATEQQVDSIYGYKVGFNPMDYKSIFVLNASTVKPGESTMADYVTAVFKSISADKAADNYLTVDYHYYGSSFTSFGNPFELTNLWAGTLQDQADLLNRKLVLSARYTYQENNVSADQLTTLTTHIINGSALFAPSTTLPQFTVNVNEQIRNTPSGVSNLVATDDHALNLTGMINYNLKTGNYLTGFNVNYTNCSRTDAINSFSSDMTQIASAAVNETMTKTGLGVDIRYSRMYYSNPETPTLLLSATYDARVRYEIKKIKTNVSVGADVNQSNASALPGSSSSVRGLYNIMVSTRVFTGLTINLEAGMAPYTDLEYSSNSYQENYAIIRLMYNFDFKR
jgi:hypothetical protein